MSWVNPGCYESLAVFAGLRIYYNHGDCIMVKAIDLEDTQEIMDRLTVVSHGCEVPVYSIPSQLLTRQLIHIPCHTSNTLPWWSVTAL